MLGVPLFLLAVVLAGLASSLWIGFSLMGAGVLSLAWFRDLPIDRVLAGDLWGRLNADELVTLPLFILMGDILYHTRLSESLFRGLAPLVQRLPGGLLHVNVLGCTLFAAVSGSSAATTATVGRMTLTELQKRGYDRDLSLGSLAGSGTIGLMIPPSIPLIVYGILAEVSILELFIAGIVPGLLIACCYIGWIMFTVWRRPDVQPQARESVSWAIRLKALIELSPLVFLVSLVIGSMYSGLASVTEAAAIGVGGALLIALFQRTLTWSNLRDALLSTVRTCSMIGLIMAGALFLSKTMAMLGIPAATAQWVGSLGLSPYVLILMLLIVYLVLGMFIDGLSSMVMTLPVALPMVVAAGFDPIWFGVFIVITIELSNITPPVGFNLFVIQHMTGERQGRVAQAALPFCALLLALVGLLTVWPQIVMWLPVLMRA
jgi:tripartite ATP-independent transporter DctM subunit